MICRAMLPLRPLPIFAILVLALTASVSPSRLGASQGPTRVLIEAGSYDRRQTVVAVPLPGLTQVDRHYELHDRQGTTLVVQMDRDGRGWVVLPALAAGSEQEYTISLIPGAASPRATVAIAGDDLAVSVAGKAVLSYIGGRGRLPSGDIKPAYQRGGYIHPVRSPSGRIVTDDYPADHRHQHGVMFAWTSADFEGRHTDFWNMGNERGRVEAVAIDASWSGVVHAGWAARHRYVDLTSGAAKPVLDEQWTTRVYAAGDGQALAHMFDVDVRQTPATPAPLELPEYHYGGMAVRGAASFMGAPGNEIVLTSEGKDRVAADNTRARWAHISGRIDGAVAGIAVLGHPDNYRAPEPLRVHPTDPYVCFAPSRLGAWSISHAQPFVAKYRFVATDGPADMALLERLWRDFAEPPKVTVR
jgi:hypothetical protein